MIHIGALFWKHRTRNQKFADSHRWSGMDSNVQFRAINSSWLRPSWGRSTGARSSEQFADLGETDRVAGGVRGAATHRPDQAASHQGRAVGASASRKRRFESSERVRILLPPRPEKRPQQSCPVRRGLHSSRARVLPAARYARRRTARARRQSRSPPRPALALSRPRCRRTERVRRRRNLADLRLERSAALRAPVRLRATQAFTTGSRSAITARQRSR
jgi:hypothetical protein